MFAKAESFTSNEQRFLQQLQLAIHHSFHRILMVGIKAGCYLLKCMVCRIHSRMHWGGGHCTKIMLRRSCSSPAEGSVLQSVAMTASIYMQTCT